MSRQDQEGKQQEVSKAFYGGQRLILRIRDKIQMFHHTNRTKYSQTKQNTTGQNTKTPKYKHNKIRM